VFDWFVKAILDCPRPVATVVEIGSGPGFLAEQILQRTDVSTYHLVDASKPMHDLAAARLSAHQHRTRFWTLDFTEPGWDHDLPTGADAVVTMQAVHELRAAGTIPRLYRDLRGHLAAGGVFIMCDQYNDDQRRRAHFLTVDEHIDAMTQAGFASMPRAHTIGDLVIITAAT
jgi:SAM-dependent methyltransferase